MSTWAMSGLLSYEELFDYFKKARGKLIEALERLPDGRVHQGAWA